MQTAERRPLTAERWAGDRGLDRGRIDVGAVELHCVVAGDPGDPLVVLLHGFPEFWYGWRHQIEPLAREFRVAVPDLRGYNLSDRPRGVEAYTLARLRADVVGVVDAFDHETARLVGHDWGGMVALSVALDEPAVVDRLVVANTAYPARFWEQASPSQLLRSSYALAFQLPALPERLLAAREFAGLRRMLTEQATVERAFTDADLERYRAAWRRPDALGAMLGYYRALGRRQLRFLPERWGRSVDTGEWGRSGDAEQRGRPGDAEPSLDVPSLLLWGDQDAALGGSVREFLEARLAPERVARYPDASHWLHAEFPERVTDDLLAFL